MKKKTKTELVAEILHYKKFTTLDNNQNEEYWYDILDTTPYSKREFEEVIKKLRRVLK